MMARGNKEKELERRMSSAVAALREWAEDNPDEWDPEAAIEEIVREHAPDDSEDTLETMLARLWDEWEVIEGEREMLNEFEDDLD